MSPEVQVCDDAINIFRYVKTNFLKCLCSAVKPIQMLNPEIGFHILISLYHHSLVCEIYCLPQTIGAEDELAMQGRRGEGRGQAKSRVHECWGTAVLWEIRKWSEEFKKKQSQ